MGDVSGVYPGPNNTTPAAGNGGSSPPGGTGQAGGPATGGSGNGSGGTSGSTLPGYRLVGADGGVFSYGDARIYGSAAELRLAAPVVGICLPNVPTLP